MLLTSLLWKVKPLQYASPLTGVKLAIMPVRVASDFQSDGAGEGASQGDEDSPAA